jgi:hypothetical protein
MIPAGLIRFLPYAAAAAVAVAALFGAYQFGSNVTATEYELQIMEMHRDAAAKLAAAERRARDMEQQAAASVAFIAEDHHREKIEAEKKMEKLRADLRASRIRLSVPVASCAGSRAATPAAAAGGSAPEARAELLPATAGDLVRIAAECDAGMRQLNAVIDAYEAAQGALK